MESTLKNLRRNAGLTQNQVSDLVRVPLRTYKRYENDPKLIDTIKYNYILNKLTEETKIDESHGVLSPDRIKTVCKSIFEHHDIEYCYLFGSYAKGSPNEKSDIDLLIATPYTGLKYFGLVEELHSAFNKNIDLLTLSQLKDNEALLNEILQYGEKIYG